MLREKLSYLLELPAIKFVGGVTGKKKVEVGGLSEEVLLFDSDKLRGMKLFNGKILVNERLFQSDAENARKHTVLHELGHRRRNLLSRLGGISQLILSPPGLIAGFTGATIFSLSLVFGIELPLIENSLKGLSGLTSVYLASMIVSYIGELDAELFAYRRMGEEQFKKSKKEAKQIFGKPSLLKSLFILPSHPPEFLTVWILNRIEPFSN